MVNKTGKRLAIAKGVRFSCKQCGDCCRQLPVSLTPDEVARYEARDWTDVLGIPGPVMTTVRSGGRKTHYLRHDKDGACIFLDENSLCRMHSVFGEAEKPLVCRTYPFVLIPPREGGRPLASAAFSCSSVSRGDGKRLNDHRAALEGRLQEVEALGLLAPKAKDPPYLGRIVYPREEIEFLFDVILAELEDAGRPFPQRILAVAKFISLVTSSCFPSLGTKTTRTQVSSFMKGIRSQVERGLLQPSYARPPLPQRLLFRLILALACQRDSPRLISAGFLFRSVHRFGNLLRGLTFMIGSGVVQPVGRDRRVVLSEVRRKAPAADAAAPVADGALTRYFVAKLSERFVYNNDYRLGLVLPSLGLLLRQYPIILLLARAACFARGGETLSGDDYASALRTADWSFGRMAWDRGLLGRMRGVLLSDVEVSFGFVPACALAPEAPAPLVRTP